MWSILAYNNIYLNEFDGLSYVFLADKKLCEKETAIWNFTWITWTRRNDNMQRG